MTNLIARKIKNGDILIYIHEDLEKYPAVTIQKNGEIRWASIGPVSVKNTKKFSDAIRLALHLSGDSQSSLCWETQIDPVI